jgi:RNA polymerase sigma-70 factor, ECF subfamily
MNERITIDHQFVVKLMRGDEKAFHRLYIQFQPSMKLICKRYAKDDASAEDLFQEAFIKLYSNIGKLKNPGSFLGWMKRIFINTAIDHYNKRKNESAESIDDNEGLWLEHADEVPVEISDIEEKKELDYQTIRYVDFSQEEIMETLRSIPEHYRIVFQLFVIDDFKHQEIADILSINEKTSKTRLLRARALLKEELQQLAILKMRNEQY